jgi:pyridoxine kinase
VVRIDTHHVIQPTISHCSSLHSDVGNKAAVFPLQLLGFDVDFVNSVHFSNHTGYENGLTGEVMNGEQLMQILKGLEDNSLLEEIGHVLTGYIGNITFLNSVLNVLERVKKYNPNFFYVCDPVLGDEGKFYVPQELVQVYREMVIPLADVVTPNQFEVEQITGITVHSMDDAKKACNALHDMGPPVVFITSVVFPDDSNDKIAIIASRRDSKTNQDEMWRIDCPLLPGRYTGTGDVTASLLLGHLAQGPDNLPRAMEKVINTVYAIIQRTHESSGETMKSKELKLIQSKGDIENPPTTFQAKRL